MKKRMLALALAVVMCLALLPTTALAATLPQAGIQDIRVYQWVTVNDEVLEAKTSETPDDPYTFFYSEGMDRGRNYYDFAHYDTESLFRGYPCTMILYDNGELYLSTKESPGANDFHKVMDHVKSIGAYYTDIYKSKQQIMVYEGYRGVDYKAIYEEEDTFGVSLATVLTEDGSLYLLGCPDEMVEENLSLRTPAKRYEKWLTKYNYTVAKADSGKTAYTSLTVEDVFPFPYQSSPETPVPVAENIAELYSGFGRGKHCYLDTNGNLYRGFPTQNPVRTAGDTIFDDGICEMKEDGSLYYQNNRVAADVKDFNDTYYMTGDGSVYELKSGERKGRNAVQLFEFAYLTEDGSIYDLVKGVKIMEDVSVVFGPGGYINMYHRIDPAFAVRTNGDVYNLVYENDGTYLPQKMFSGSGEPADPAPPFHAGKVFKNASTWALIDLRDARTSGLTIPTANLDYNRPITREQFCEVAVKLYEALSGKKAVATKGDPFDDTDNPEILKAYALGIVNGTSDTTFSPKQDINRESTATMLKRTADAAGVKLSGAPKSFADAASFSSWAATSVNDMAAAGVINGVGGNRFDPKGTATVEQAVIMANRILR